MKRKLVVGICNRADDGKLRPLVKLIVADNYREIRTLLFLF
jgi:hypothetical protein